MASPDNICEKLLKYNTPEEFDLLSLDIDSNDWYVLKSILYGGFKPSVIILEYNPIYAGWSSGYVYDEYEQPLVDLQLTSLLNGKTFETDQSGYYDFGFPEGIQDFEFLINNSLDTLSITFYSHQEIEQDIYTNSNDIDFVNNQDDLKQILDVIRTPFSGTKFFNPVSEN